VWKFIIIIIIIIIVSDGAHASYCTNDCHFLHATRIKQKLILRMIRSVKFHACGPSRVRDQICMTLKTSLVVEKLSKSLRKISKNWISRPSTSLQRLKRLDRFNRRDTFSMKKSLRSSARGASFHTKHTSNVNAIETY
jgi:hypothetical protein